MSHAEVDATREAEVRAGRGAGPPGRAPTAARGPSAGSRCRRRRGDTPAPREARTASIASSMTASCPYASITTPTWAAQASTRSGDGDATSRTRRRSRGPTSTRRPRPSPRPGPTRHGPPREEQGRQRAAEDRSPPDDDGAVRRERQKGLGGDLSEHEGRTRAGDQGDDAPSVPNAAPNRPETTAGPTAQTASVPKPDRTGERPDQGPVAGSRPRRRPRPVPPDPAGGRPGPRRRGRAGPGR